LLMARAAAPMFRALREETRITWRWSSSVGVGTGGYSNARLRRVGCGTREGVHGERGFRLRGNLHGRAQRAAALRRQRLRRLQISNLKFQIEETAKAKAKAKAKANADLSPLKGIRDDSGVARVIACVIAREGAYAMAAPGGSSCSQVSRMSS
jgi:hypothetical protein